MFFNQLLKNAFHSSISFIIIMKNGKIGEKFGNIISSQFKIIISHIVKFTLRFVSYFYISCS